MDKSDEEDEGPGKKRPRLEESEAEAEEEANQVQTVRLTPPPAGGSSEEDSPCTENCGKVPDEEGLSNAIRRHQKFLSVHVSAKPRSAEPVSLQTDELLLLSRGNFKSCV